MAEGVIFTTLHFCVMNALNKLECYITLDWKSFPVRNTLAYLAYS
jgi:hypothetical protein